MKAAKTSTFFLNTRKISRTYYREKHYNPIESRIDAIQKLQPPTNKKKIQEFVGMLNFLNKYVYKMQF